MTRALLIALVAIVALVAWLATRDGREAPPPASANESDLVSIRELRDVAGRTGHPVYWAGPIADTSLETTEGAGGSVEVRYLPEGGVDETSEALTIGSYPIPNPRAALRAFADRPGSVTHRGARGREVVVGRRSRTSAYFVDPGNEVQVEVYDPSPARALALARSARIESVN
jgi:hypothetical protein